MQAGAPRVLPEREMWVYVFVEERSWVCDRASSSVSSFRPRPSSENVVEGVDIGVSSGFGNAEDVGM